MLVRQQLDEEALQLRTDALAIVADLIQYAAIACEMVVPALAVGEEDGAIEAALTVLEGVLQRRREARAAAGGADALGDRRQRPILGHVAWVRLSVEADDLARLRLLVDCGGKDARDLGHRHLAARRETRRHRAADVVRH